MKLKRFTLFLLICQLHGGLVSPPNNKTLFSRHVNFKWDQVPDAVSYQLNVASDPDFENILFTVLDNTLSHIDTEHLEWDQTLYWKINAFNETDNVIYTSESFVFHTGSAKFPNANLEIFDSSQANGDLTIFGDWYDIRSGVVDEYGQEIWNDGNLNVMMNFVDEYGQMFGSQDYPLDNVWMRGIQFNATHNLLWTEPHNINLDTHELRRLPNGNFVGMNRVDQMGPVPLGAWTQYFQNLGYVADGATNEIEWYGQQLLIIDHETEEIVWSWDPFEHYSMEDYDSIGGSWWNVQSWGYDWIHSNSIYFDEAQSSFYVSHRNISRISKINYPSGDVEWMMGLPEQYMASGAEHLCNELLFSFQHEAELLPNGNLLFYDNGNLSPLLHGYDNPITRVLEISMNEDNLCDVVWEYNLPEDLFAINMGSVQVLDNGNYQITSGNQCGTILEVTPEHEIVWKLTLELPICEKGLYRAYRVKTLFPQNFSLLLDNYSYLDEDQTVPGIHVDENNPLSFTIHNESPDEIQFLATTYELEDSPETPIHDPIEFFVETGEMQTIEIPDGDLVSGLYNLRLNIKPFPFYREGESVDFSIMKSASMAVEPGTPESFLLKGNYPNPFNPNTTISFKIGTMEAEPVFLEIFDLKGQLVKTLLSRKLNSGSYEITWDGTNDTGQFVAAGVYIYKMEIGELIETRKMTLMK